MIGYVYLFLDCINNFYGYSCSIYFGLKNEYCDKMIGISRYGCNIILDIFFVNVE